jgi:hypothetical protein
MFFFLRKPYLKNIKFEKYQITDNEKNKFRKNIKVRKPIQI